MLRREPSVCERELLTALDAPFGHAGGSVWKRLALGCAEGHLEGVHARSLGG